MNELAVAERHETFAREYARDFNAVRAAIVAGYSKDRAGSTAAELRRRPEIRARIMELVEERKKLVEIDPNLVLHELALLGFSKMGDFYTLDDKGDPHFDFSNLTEEQQRCVESLEIETYMEGKGEYAREVKKIKFKLANKAQALLGFAKLTGLDPSVVPPPTNPTNSTPDEDDDDVIYFVEPKKLKE